MIDVQSEKKNINKIKTHQKTVGDSNLYLLYIFLLKNKKLCLKKKKINNEASMHKKYIILQCAQRWQISQNEQTSLDLLGSDL